MEYILMTLFIVIIVTVLIFFLMGWQFTQFRAEESKAEADQALFIMKFFLKSPYFTRDESLFDDAKLLAFTEMGDKACDELSMVFGRDWFAQIYYINGDGELCSSMSAYETCDYWEFCVNPDPRIKTFSYDLPVNIYNSSGRSNHLGILKIGVYYYEDSSEECEEC